MCRKDDEDMSSGFGGREHQVEPVTPAAYMPSPREACLFDLLPAKAVPGLNFVKDVFVDFKGINFHHRRSYTIRCQTTTTMDISRPAS